MSDINKGWNVRNCRDQLRAKAVKERNEAHKHTLWAEAYEEAAALLDGAIDKDKREETASEIEKQGE